MPITFGSVGDIISVCLLVKDVVDALDKARGSKAEYQSMIRELWILDRVLLEVDLLCRTHEGGKTPELNALCQTARKAVDRCKDLVNDFMVRLKKYQSAFHEGSSSSTNIFKTTALKVRWRVGEKDAVEKFRVDIAATSASLQMLLATASVNLVTIHGNKVDRRMSDMQGKDEAHRTKADATFASLLDRLEETNRLITSGNSATNKIADALRLDWLRQLGSELKSFMRRIIAMNIATYHAVLSIQSTLPPYRERGLIEEPFILEDPIGRIAPVHLQFVTSWDAFHAVLEIRFRNIQGHAKIKKQQCGLQDKATKRDIEQGRRWDGVLLPGQRVEMSFLFDQEGNRVESTCPSCQARSSSPPTEEVQCSNCHLWYRRITVLQEAEEYRKPPSPAHWKLSRPAFGKPGFEGRVLGPAKPGKKRASPSDPNGEDDIRCFKRVRLIAKKRRARNYAFGASMAARDEYVSFAAISSLSHPIKGSGPLLRSAPVPRAGEDDMEDAASIPDLDPATVIRQDLEDARQAWASSSRRFDPERPPRIEIPISPPFSPKIPPPLPVFRPYLIPKVNCLGPDELITTSTHVWIASTKRLSDSFDREWPDYNNLGPCWKLGTHEIFRCMPLPRKGAIPSWYLPIPLWPTNPLSIRIALNFSPDPAKSQSPSTPHTYYFDSEDILELESVYGTAFCFPYTETIFYSASFGRWLFDWADEHISPTSGRNITYLRAAHVFWGWLEDCEAVISEWRRGFFLPSSTRDVGRRTPTSTTTTRTTDPRGIAAYRFMVLYRLFWYRMVPSCRRAGGDPRRNNPRYDVSENYFCLYFIETFLCLVRGEKAAQKQQLTGLLGLARSYANFYRGGTVSTSYCFPREESSAFAHPEWFWTDAKATM